MNDVDVVIVGGGPVGLYLGCLLALRGRSFIVLESRTDRVDHSRSIGIHPPLLESMAGIGLADRLIDDGVKIERGHGYWNGRKLGAMDFTRLPGPYRFVLSLPQTETERRLEERLEELVPGTLKRGVRVDTVSHTEDRARVAGEWSGEAFEQVGRFVVGCDGKHSVVRKEAGFEFRGAPYEDRYVMGDFAESTELGTDAALCLGPRGLVESFPLPSGERRWVVRRPGEGEFGSRVQQGARPAGPDGHEGATGAVADVVADTVRARTAWRIDPKSASMTSSFGVERFEARPMASERVFLAGDAAHVISPIGGQGMNLGWLDADALAERLDTSIRGDERVGSTAATYRSHRRRAFARARRRAEFNMWMGRARPIGPRGVFVSGLKAVTARLILIPGIRAACARQFTMHGLDDRSG